jgi:hypothetical protein
MRIIALVTTRPSKEINPIPIGILYPTELLNIFTHHKPTFTPRSPRIIV